MNWKVSFFMILLAIFLIGCNNVSIHSNEKTVEEKIQIEQPEKSDSKATNNPETDEQNQPTEQVQNKNQTETEQQLAPIPNIPNVSSYDPTLIQAKEIANQITYTTQTAKMRAALRSGPGLGYGTLAEVLPGTFLYVESTSVEPNTYRIWCYVKYNFQYGWISYKTLNPDYSLQTEFRTGN